MARSTFFARLIISLAALFLAAIAVPVSAEQLAPDGAPNPTGSVVNERTLLQEYPRITGRIDIPDTRADVLIQPAGRTWDWFHQVFLPWGGAIAILGMIVALAVAYLIIGKLRILGGRSGQTVLRFDAFERFAHWLTAVSFVILALTGLNITFGKTLLLPLIGPEAFASLAEAAKYVHNFVAFAFVVGLAIITVIFFRGNLFRKVDIEWVKQGGGFIPGKHAPAGRFNAGEKMVYWLSVLAGIAITVSGFLLLFPFSVTNIAGMQLAQVVHAVVAMLFIALIIAHIYIGTVGMEGAFEAMGTGDVDLNWAKEHHDVWVREMAEARPASHMGEPTPRPAE